MTRHEFVRALESQMEIPEGNLNSSRVLTEVDGWDSLAAVLFIALADEKVGVIISGDQVAKAKTLDELLSLLGDRLTP
jgi:acyl carrier protein